MDLNPQCIQFYVQKNPFRSNGSLSEITQNPSSFVLHLDEVDISGICNSQLHCSLKYPIRKDCKKNFECDFKKADCENLVEKSKLFFGGKQSIMLGTS